MGRNNLVIRLSALGDVAMVVAVMRQAALQHPEKEYTLLSHQRMQALLMDMPSNVHFSAYEETIDWARYDYVIDAHNVPRSRRLDWKARCHFKPVIRLKKPRLQRWLLIHGKRANVPSMLELYARLLEVSTPLPLYSFSSQLPKKDIGIAPFAAHRGKVYPLEKMEELVESVSEKWKEEKIYLFGFGEEEKRICEAWEKKYTNVISLVGKHTMAQELEIMRNLRVMIAMDSGNMHLASLVGTRVISIWGATHPSMGFLAYGQSEKDCVTRHLPCAPCSAYGKKKCKYGDYRCLNIAPQDIANRL